MVRREASYKILKESLPVGKPIDHALPLNLSEAPKILPGQTWVFKTQHDDEILYRESQSNNMSYKHIPHKIFPKQKMVYAF